ncbi:GDP-fucose protein O-fucosyltransferase 1 isoform X1 [Phymastichus coffea]|uniref:GDP-fucose protein O-fucosyltransferase 1 isoform X1 n=1 Tax=Phymastichus coffea TaxID=108790 RepID=UPI00273C8DEC|nr:GDP-fucose protein O-fucosyltransferase 1 isoform X1 [Phymastichus coffea]XP_058805059.1 GDP-fucose protein O-fucosyltransferase 1 isoform X1 [Phymastichus coffea]
MKIIQVPFDTYFNISQVLNYHRAILMENFMKDVAPVHWPPSKRIAFCYKGRGSTDSCNAKDGNPFGPFWDTFNIDFVGSEFYGPLHFDVHHTDMAFQWRQKYTSAKWPVLAFTGAPASFPIQIENKKLQKYLIWNDIMMNKAKSFIKNTFPPGAFIGIHLRNGIDWERACEFISSSPNLFAAPQCLGYRNERGKATHAMCLPSFELIVRHIKRVIRNGKDVKSVFIASDNNYYIPELTKALERVDVKVFRQVEDISPHLDLVILGRANYFIGNCISSFSAFVAREREVKGYPTYFLGFPPEKTASSTVHEEF